MNAHHTASDTRIRCVLLDIEGTVGSIHFVHQVLFPLSARALPEFVAQAEANGIAAECEALRARLAQEKGVPPGTDFRRAVSTADLVETLLGWIRDDRKEGLLKAIQGKIWRQSFESGQIQAHLYPDVPEAMARWVAAGKTVAIFSSGSIEAQQLYFGHSEYGDLTGLISRHFDTTTGPKREADTYRRIATQLGVLAREVVFYSDVEAELEAAQAAGMRVGLLAREAPVKSRFPVLTHFEGE